MLEAVGKLEYVQKILLILAIGVSLAGCSAGRAQVIEDQPTLVVPPVPPRAIEPPQPTDLPAVAPVVEIPAAPAAPSSKPANRSATNRGEPKPDPKPEVPPDTSLPATPPTSGTVPPLRTPTTPSGPEAERQIKEVIDWASTTLSSRIDYQKLSPDGKANYDTAKGFIDQGLEALKKGDLGVAKSFAGRAEQITKLLLQGR